MGEDEQMVRIDSDEWHPVYSVRENGGLEVEATPEQLERWAKVWSDWLAVQDEMGELYHAAALVERERRERERAEREAAEKAERERATRQRAREAQARRAKQDAMWQQIEASGGVVYDANGQRVGTVGRGGMSGVRLEP